MRIYLDSNVYRFVSEQAKVEDFRDLIKARHAAVIASTELLAEVLGIRDWQQRQVELKALTRMSTTFQSPPVSYLQAEEVLLELRRLRPGWLRPIVYRKSIKAFLKAHLSRWSEARRGLEPEWRGRQAYRSVSESGIRQSRDLQKALRAAPDAVVRIAEVSRRGTPVTDDFGLDDPEMYWRFENATTWYNALVTGSESSRDYADWLLPYLNESALMDWDSFRRFWVEEVDAKRVLRNQLTSLVSYYQLRSKISHGNAADALHAAHVVDVDLFLTSDLAFFGALEKAVERIGVNGSIRFVNRLADDAVAEIATHLDVA